MIKGKLRKGVVQGIADLLGAKASLWSENWPASDLLAACYEERKATAWQSEDGWDAYSLKYDPDGKHMRYEKVP